MALPLRPASLFIPWVCCFSTGAAAFDSRPILDLIPAGSLVVYAAKPYTSLVSSSTQPAAGDRPPPVGVSSIASIIAFLNASGLVPDEGQVFADIAAALPLLGRFEHALALIDVSTRLVTTGPAGDDLEQDISLRLNSLQTALVLRTRGDHRAVLEHVNRVVGRYTNLDVAALTTRRFKDHTYQRLVDQRLPAWAIWEWGRLGDFFILSFGAGAYERICGVFADTGGSLSQDPWYQSAASRTRCDQALVQWMIAFGEVRRRLGEIAEDRVAAVSAALQAGDISRDLWTIGQEGPSLSCYRCYRRGRDDVVRRYSDPRSDPPAHRAIIPEEARHTAVIRIPTRWLVDNIPRAWLAAQSMGNADKWRRIWGRLEEETGLDISGSLFNHLGQHVVIFDYPPHPLNIPFALTVAIEITDPRAVGMALDALLGAWGRYLDERAERNKTTLVRLKVRQFEDRVWYLQAGILGPALKVTPRYILLSWSPEALRDAESRISRTDPRAP